MIHPVKVKHLLVECICIVMTHIVMLVHTKLRVVIRVHTQYFVLLLLLLIFNVLGKHIDICFKK